MPSGRSARGHLAAISPPAAAIADLASSSLLLWRARSASAQTSPGALDRKVRPAEQPRAEWRNSSPPRARRRRPDLRGRAARRQGGSPIPPPSPPAPRPARRREHMRGERLQQRLGRRRPRVEPLERLAPPGEADRGSQPLRAGGEDRGQGDVKTPQRLDRRPRRARGHKRAQAGGRDRGRGPSAMV